MSEPFANTITHKILTEPARELALSQLGLDQLELDHHLDGSSFARSFTKRKLSALLLSMVAEFAPQQHLVCI